MSSSFASYLASLDALPSPLSSLVSPSASCALNAPLESASPQKRPRSDSPDSDTVRTDSFFTTTSSSTGEGAEVTTVRSTSTTTANGCVIRSILTHFTTTTSSTPSASASSSSPSLVASSPLSSSPPTSCPLSRRSSASASKSVRFARCTNASVFPALSGEEYDRSPIVPTCESESLEMPRRGRSEEGWIRCVERARKKAEGEKKGCAIWKAKEKDVEGEAFGLVEGVNGLIGARSGGYFVGDEKDDQGYEMEDADEEDDGDDMVVDDDFEEGNDEDDDAEEHKNVPSPSSTPQVAEESSSGEESDVPSTLSDSSNPSSPPSSTSTHFDEPTLKPSSNPKLVGLGFERTDSITTDEEEDEEERRRREEEEIKAERRRACKAKYGLCSLGKFTRKEVFQSYDSLGGF